MKFNHYQIDWYTPDYLQDVCELLEGFWEKDPDINIAHFKWKYLDNPYTDKPLALIAKHKNNIVGFKGLFITKWEIADQQLFLVCASDGKIHPDHRRKGLYSSLTNYHLQQLDTSEYNAYIETSGNINATKASLKLGWKPLAPRIYPRKTTFTNVMMMYLKKKLGFNLQRNNITFGTYNNIEISKSCHYKDIIKLEHTINNNNNVLQLVKDETFYKWRFGSERRNYMFYYYYEQGELKAYIIVLVEEYNIAKIIDYAFVKKQYISSLLTHIIKNNHFNIISILEISLNDELKEILRRMNFSANDLFSIFIKEEENLQITIRPVKNEYKQNDWKINTLDIRKSSNWMIKEICSDGV